MRFSSNSLFPGRELRSGTERGRLPARSGGILLLKVGRAPPRRRRLRGGVPEEGEAAQEGGPGRREAL